MDSVSIVCDLVFSDLLIFRVVCCDVFVVVLLCLYVEECVRSDQIRFGVLLR